MKKLVFLFSCFISSLSLQSAMSTSTMQSIIEYSLYFKSYNAICIASVNGVKAISNYENKGPLSAGLNTSAYLENGSNTLTLDVAGLATQEGDHRVFNDLYCQLKMVREISGDRTSKQDLFTLVASVNDKHMITGQESSYYIGSIEKTIGQVSEGELTGTYLYRISREFIATDISEWAWTTAKSFEPTEENMEKLRRAYTELWQIMNDKNISLFKEKCAISFSEKEFASGYPQNEDVWYHSLDFDEDFAESIGMMPINFDDYKLVMLNKGRLVKLDNQGVSPLSFKNQEGEGFSDYAPYFSLIDGKMVVTR